MMFVNAAKVQLRNYLDQVKQAGTNEQVTWMVYNSDYTAAQRAEISKYAIDNGLNLKYIDNADQVVNYVNTKSINSSPLIPNDFTARTEDQITDLSVFSHGMGGNIALGFQNTLQGTGWLGFEQLSQFSPTSFAKGSNIDLFSCNSASVYHTMGVSMSLSQAMSNANSPGSVVFSLTQAVPQSFVHGLIGQYQYSPVRNGQLPTPGHTGGDYSPRIGGSKLSPAVPVTGSKGQVSNDQIKDNSN
jgi:hypothetical protein